MTPDAGPTRPEELAAGGDAPLAQDAPPLTLGAAAPDPVVDPVLERVFEAFVLDGALEAHPASALDTYTVRREELTRGGFAAPGPQHPRGGPVVGGEEGEVVHGVQR